MGPPRKSEPDPDRAYEQLLEDRDRAARVAEDWRHGDQRFFYWARVHGEGKSENHGFWVGSPEAWFADEEVAELDKRDPRWRRIWRCERFQGLWRVEVARDWSEAQRLEIARYKRKQAMCPCGRGRKVGLGRCEDCLRHAE